MKEIISLQIGKCGNNIGTQFWELLCYEHGLNPAGIYRGACAEFQLQFISNYFREIRGMRYVPRAIMIDLDREAMESVKSSVCASMFRDDNFVYGTNGTGNNWAKAHLTEGVQLKESILEVTRREAENTDCLHGFQIIHSIGGGTGSGLTALLMNSLKDEYSSRNLSTFTVVPSPDDPKSGMEIYNAVLAMSHLVIHGDATYFADNQALHRLFTGIPKMAHYELTDLNHVISSAISGITTCMRFRGHCSTDFRKITLNYVPFPRMHFFVPALAPIVPRSDMRPKTNSVAELLHSLFVPKKLFVECDMSNGKILTVAFFVRGNVCMKDVINKLEEIQDKNSSKFVEWVPDNAKAFVYELPASLMSVSATMISNTTAIQHLLKRLKDQFYSMFRRKAFLTPYTSEGMEEMEFEEAASSLTDLVDEYKASQVSRTDTGTPSRKSKASLKED
ncbi:UNVERIFIED_CONTAM: hypothetical protein PYX00_009354 [Menopon gallinae]|uniref:Tubulin beta chain n=1 Tax=Menopon gallinae TaxID=328185 RepID=A0AAW2HB59_9NEOP